MKCFVVLAALLVVAASEAPSGPYPPSGWKPSGRRLILPSRQQTQRLYGPPPAEYGPPHPSTSTAEPSTVEPTTTEAATEPPTEQPEAETDASASDGQSERLQNADSGVYYVLLPDGKLQRVQYMTSPIVALPSQRIQSAPTSSVQIVRYVQVHPQQEQEVQRVVQQEPPAFNGFVANVHYTNVEPISGPVYAYSPAPLVRILKK